MECCHCREAERIFGDRTARADLRRYQRRGPAKTTRLLVGALAERGVTGLSVLDIGGGIGAIQHELVAAGAASSTDVDASSAYLAAAKAEAARRGYADRATYLRGNFVDVAESILPADVVTLERVVCCYPNMSGLVGASAEKARRYYGLVYPRDAWWMRLGGRLINAMLWVQRSAFRFYIHPSAAVDAVARASGLARSFYQTSGPWQVVLYERAGE